ncbi:MAG: 30S ribosome-binding factor RbfA [Acidimicrobiia bacterium]
MRNPKRTTRPYPRRARVDEVVREALADEIERLSDPRLELVTVTGVDVSPDLRHATVYYSALTAEHADVALRAAAPHLRAALGRQVRLKYLPELRFEEDPAIATGARVEEILRNLRRGSGVETEDDITERTDGSK